MNNAAITFDRRLELLFLLYRNKHLTVSEIAEYFSVCKKTIYRDITFLSRYAPIYTKNGFYGGVFMLKDYRNELVLHLSDDEKELLNKLKLQLSGKEYTLLQNILNKYSAPEIRT